MGASAGINHDGLDQWKPAIALAFSGSPTQYIKSIKSSGNAGDRRHLLCDMAFKVVMLRSGCDINECPNSNKIIDLEYALTVFTYIISPFICLVS
jgi:hypothetical protein